MPSVYDIKPAFQRLLRPLTGVLARAGITANQVTVCAALLSIATGALIAYFPDRPRLLLLLPAVLFLRMALNAIDGMLARELGQKSHLGALLNEIGDVVSDAALYLALALVPGFDAPLIVLIVVLAAIGELTGVAAIGIGASRRYDGPMGKSDRAFVFGALALALGCGLTPGWWLQWVLVVIVLLAVWTVLNRIRRALNECSNPA